MWALGPIAVLLLTALTAEASKQLVSVHKRSVFLYRRECEDDDLHKTFIAGEVWKSRCIVWTCAVTPGGAFNIPVKLECENMKMEKDKEMRQCVKVGSTNLTIKRNEKVFKHCDCVWMFNQLQYHCPVEKETLTGKADESHKEVKKVTDVKSELEDSKKLASSAPDFVPEKEAPAAEAKKEGESEAKKIEGAKLPPPEKKTPEEKKGE